MNKSLFITALSLLASVSASAQFNGAGYYRVGNVGLKNLMQKDCYVRITDSKINVIEQQGTGQDFEPLQLVEGLDDAIASPNSVIYAYGTASNLKLEAQGTNVSDVAQGRTMQLSSVGTSYTLSTVAAGATVYLYTTTRLFIDHYIGTTKSASKKAYSYWNIIPITVEGDNYVGVKPTLNAGGRYYAPYYASYPFKLHSAGMKAYYVSAYDNEHFQLEEITQEVIPAATPVLIECASQNVSDNRLELVTGSYSAVSDNRLSGVYFCNDFISESFSPGCRTQFDAGTMRVWNVENDQLVLSTATDLLHTDKFDSDNVLRYLNANQSYLSVPAGIANTMTIGTVGIADVKAEGGVAEPVSYVSADGSTNNSLQPGVNIVKYSDGTVRKIIK